MTKKQYDRYKKLATEELQRRRALGIIKEPLTDEAAILYGAYMFLLGIGMEREINQLREMKKWSKPSQASLDPYGYGGLIGPLNDR
ncbi:MAG: hypothetical protein J5647_00050 [Spirochaetaceae bacterium]|nr:hypothetical protein [Spirochaetaceae bacterium]